jgi:hypothetical protein
VLTGLVLLCLALFQAPCYAADRPTPTPTQIEIKIDPALLKEGKLNLGGKLIRTRLRGTPTPTPESESGEAELTGTTDETAVPAEVLAATAVATATPTATATPAPVKIKVAKLINGKIMMVEIEVTPTPAPANVQAATASVASGTAATEIASTTVTSGTQAASLVLPATGVLAEVRDKLLEAKKFNKSIDLSPKQAARLREQVMTRTTKDKEKLKDILSATDSVQLQIKVHRFAAGGKSVSIDPPTAILMLKVLWPDQWKESEKRAKAAKAGAKQAGVPGPASGEEEAEGDLFIDEDSAQEGSQIYIDPRTGQYVYEDGTPVYAQQPPPPPPPPQRPPPGQQPPPVYYEPPPPPGPPPIEEGLVGEIDSNYEQESYQEGEYEEDPSMQEEPPDNVEDQLEEDQFVEPDYEQDFENAEPENFEDYQEFDGEPEY